MCSGRSLREEIFTITPNRRLLLAPISADYLLWCVVKGRYIHTAATDLFVVTVSFFLDCLLLDDSVIIKNSQMSVSLLNLIRDEKKCVK